MSILEQLVEKNPNISLWQRDLAVSHRLVGDALYAQGDLAGAQKEYQISISVMTEVVKKEPSNAMWRRDLAAIHAVLSMAQQAAGDSAGALDSAHSGLAQINAVTNDPSPDDTQQELADIQRSIGEALRTQGEAAGALAADREAVRIMEELAAKAPAHALWQRDLAVSHGKAGLDLLAEGDISGARTELRNGLDIVTRLAALDPSNADWQQDLGELHRGNGDMARAASDDVAAGKEYEACAGISEPMVSRGSTNKKLLELVAYCRSNAAGNGRSRAETGRSAKP